MLKKHDVWTDKMQLMVKKIDLGSGKTHYDYTELDEFFEILQDKMLETIKKEEPIKEEEPEPISKDAFEEVVEEALTKEEELDDLPF